MQRTTSPWRLWAALAILLLWMAVAATASASELPAQKDRAEAQAFIDKATADYNAALASSYKKGQAVVPATGPLWSADLGTWVEYTFPAESGASCMNGTPYRMYYKIAPEASMRDKVLVDFEGGGACWDFESCSSHASPGVANPDGLPSGYIKGDGWLSKTTLNLTSPLLDGNTKLVEMAAYLLYGRGSGALTDRSWWNFTKHTSQPETQRWTKLVFPYCTGDVNSGASFKVFEDPNNSSNTKPVNFNGLNNVQAAMKFLREHSFAQSLSKDKSIRQMLVYGVSAGGYASQINYPMIREALAGPGTRVAMFSDSGPILPGAVYEPGEDIPGSALDATPAVKFWQKVAPVWGWFQQPTAADAGTRYEEQAKGMVARWEQASGEKVELLKARGGDMSNINLMLSRRYAADRLGLASFQRDETIPKFIFGGGRNAELDGLQGDALLEARQRLFTKELTLLRAKLGPLANHGYYMPWRRNVLASHVTTAFTFGGTDIARPENLHDDGGRIAPEFNGDVGFFVNNLISERRMENLPVLKEVGAPGTASASGSVIGGILGVVRELFGLG